MPAENRVSFKLTDAEITAINTSITTLKTTLSPYLLSLTYEERQALPKMSDKTLAFVTKGLSYTKLNPEFSPPYLDIAALEEDVVNTELLLQFLKPLQAIVSNIDDTAMLAGSEGYTAILSYYNSVKQAAKQNVPNAKNIHEDMKTRFPQKGGKKNDDKPESK